MTGHIRRRNGRWQARYRAPDNKERSRTFDRKADAQRWLAAQQHELNTGAWTDPRSGRITLTEWVDQHRATTNTRPATQAKNAVALNRWFLPSLGDVRMTAITSAHVQAVISDMSDAGLADSTIRSYVGAFQSVMSAAVADGVLAKSPAVRVRLPRVERSEVRPLEVDELWRLADSVDVRYRALVVLSGLVGLRFGECAALRWSRVDLDRPSVRVAETLTEVEGVLRFGPPKTGAARRTLVVPPVVASELREHASLTLSDDLVFVAPNGGPLRRSTFRGRVWLPAVESAGVGWATPHTLRHTAASILIAGGAHPRMLQARLGHASARMSLEVYGHLFDAADDDAASLIQGVASGGT